MTLAGEQLGGGGGGRDQVGDAEHFDDAVGRRRIEENGVSLGEEFFSGILFF